MSDGWTTLTFAGSALFVAPENIAVRALRSLTNDQPLLDRHEFEFSVTPVPAILMGIAFGCWLYRHLRSGVWPALRARTIVLVLLLLAVLAMPIALNTYEPDWNALLKSLPVLGSASTLFRFLFVYVPVIAVATALALDSLCRSAPRRAILSAAACAAVIAMHAVVDRGFYAAQAYDPLPVSNAFRQARAPEFMPSITRIGAHMDPQGKLVLRSNRNDALIQRVSQLACYNPMFGYALENFPFGSLRPGDPLQEHDGALNLKNPACYLFPRENGCEPGSHFTASQRAEAERFLGYGRYPFNRSTAQHVADVVNRLSLVAVPLLALFSVPWPRKLRWLGTAAGISGRSS
jgi:hypothetical protein